MKKNTSSGAVLATFCLGIVPVALADLEPISDQEMGQVQGQAMFSIDRTGQGTEQYTRVTMGMDVEVQTNVDTVALGEDGTGTDLDIGNLSLGHIARDDTRVQIDGNTYSAGQIVPFVGENPYLELAERDGEIIGVRLGLGRARGTLSGDIESFSGQLGLQIQDEDGTVSPAALLDAMGNRASARATHIGLSGDGTDCSTGTRCAPLGNLQSLNIGKALDAGGVGFTEDLFVSFQKEAVDWQQLNEAGDPGAVIQAAEGVFLNLPTGMTIDLQTLQNGIPRERTEYIDRGVGLF
jgi:hypothetical protein